MYFDLQDVYVIMQENENNERIRSKRIGMQFMKVIKMM